MVRIQLVGSFCKDTSRMDSYYYDMPLVVLGTLGKSCPRYLPTLLYRAPESSTVFAPTVIYGIKQWDSFSMYERKSCGLADQSKLWEKKGELRSMCLRYYITETCQSAEAAWHVALCRHVWAQLERNACKKKQKNKVLRPPPSLQLIPEFPACLWALSRGAFSEGACKPPRPWLQEKYTWLSLSCWSLDDVSRLFKALVWTVVFFFFPNMCKIEMP